MKTTTPATTSDPNSPPTATDPQACAEVVDTVGHSLDGLNDTISYLHAVVGMQPWQMWARQMASRLETERNLLAVIHRGWSKELTTLAAPPNEGDPQ